MQMTPPYIVSQGCLANHRRDFNNSVNKSNFISLTVIYEGKFNWIWAFDFHGLWCDGGVRTLYCWDDCSVGGDGDYQIKLAGSRRDVPTSPSSEQIQFHSINIDVPANGFNSALRPLVQVIHTGHSCSYACPWGAGCLGYSGRMWVH